MYKDPSVFQPEEPKKKEINSLQSVLLVFAVLLSLSAVAGAWVWADTNNLEDLFLGGLSWSTDKVINWHVVCMVGFFMFMTLALVSYRALPLGKPRNKLLHVLWHTLAIASCSVGVFAAFRSHNIKESPSANLWSLHSWVGIAAITMFGQNYVLAALFFGTSWMHPNLKKVYLSYHQVLGEVAFVLVMAAVESGITEMNAFRGCYDYSVTAIDNDPAAHYSDMAAGCRLSNGVGVMVVATAVCVFVVLKSFPNHERSSNSQRDPLLS